MKKHFVVFCSPGTFFDEITEKPIESWNVKEAIKMSTAIKERHGATPFGFYFITRERGKNDLDSHISKTSGTYFLGGQILTLNEVKALNNKDYRILISNMEGNEIDRIIINTNSWKVHKPFMKGDTLLNVNMEE